jgi:hypothetical protein
LAQKAYSFSFPTTGFPGLNQSHHSTRVLNDPPNFQPRYLTSGAGAGAGWLCSAAAAWVSVASVADCDKPGAGSNTTPKTAQQNNLANAASLPLLDFPDPYESEICLSCGSEAIVSPGETSFACKNLNSSK